VIALAVSGLALSSGRADGALDLLAVAYGASLRAKSCTPTASREAARSPVLIARGGGHDGDHGDHDGGHGGGGTGGGPNGGS
jgi:hypothetical protein